VAPRRAGRTSGAHPERFGQLTDRSGVLLDTG
jgi:hypothetical protein